MYLQGQTIDVHLFSSFFIILYWNFCFSILLLWLIQCLSFNFKRKKIDINYMNIDRKKWCEKGHLVMLMIYWIRSFFFPKVTSWLINFHTNREKGIKYGRKEKFNMWDWQQMNWTFLTIEIMMNDPRERNSSNGDVHYQHPLLNLRGEKNEGMMIGDFSKKNRTLFSDRCTSADGWNEISFF